MGLQAGLVKLRVGGRVQIETTGGDVLASEIIGFRDGHALCLPFGPLTGVRLGCKAVFQKSDGAVYPSEAWLGRVINANGEPIDGLGPIARGAAAYPLRQSPLPAHERARVGAPLDMGVRTLNTFTTMCEGQRMGIFAGSGVGKSVLMGQMIAGTECDVIVVGLIGERSREVSDFVETKLPPEVRKKSVVVAVPANHSPVLRIRGALRATAIAEGFRAEGKKVLLIMDSLTRVAHAGREIGLALGEPASARGYPPSVFSVLPELVESAGNGENPQGSMSAIYTVLAEGDDQQDPVVDTARAILDGHIVLSRALAESGHYPAIDVEASASRVMHNVAPPSHLELARKFRANYSRYQKSRDLIQLGAYVAGSDPETDRAIVLYPGLQRFLMQDMREAAPMGESVRGLQTALQEDKPARDATAGNAARGARPHHNPYEGNP